MIKLLKKVFLGLTLLSCFSALAQSPGISYQAVIINTQGIAGQDLPGENLDDELFTNREVSLRFKIYNSNNQDEYVEEHINVITDAYGMINVVIGWGNPTFNTFKDIEWDGKDKWLDVYISFAPPAYNTLELKKPLFSLPTPGAITQEQFDNLSDSLLAHYLEDQDTDLSNEIQNISLDTNNLILSNGGGVIDLTPFLNTDNQNISINNTNLSIDGGNTVDLSSIQDGTGTDDQALSISNDTIYLADGGFVKLPSQTVDTQLDSVGISDLGFVAGPHTVNTDNQDLTLSNDTLYIDNGNFIVLPSGTVDTDDQLLSLSNDTIFLVDGGFVKLPSQTVDTQLDSVGISDLGFVAGPHTVNTDNQDLTLSNDTLYIDNGNFIVLPSGTVDTDDQLLSLSNDTIFLVDGGFVKLPSQTVDTQLDSVGISDLGFVAGPHTVNTDNQDLTLSNDTLYIDNGNFIVLPSGTVDTDDQLLSLSNDTIFLVDGGFVKLPSQTVDTQLDSVGISDLGFVAGPHTVNTDNQDLTLSNDTLYIDNGNFIVLPSGTMDTDDQLLTLSNDTIFLVDGGFVKLPSQTVDTQLDSIGISDLGFVAGPHTVNTDDQALSISNDTIYLADGGFVKLPSQTVDTQLDSVGISDLGFVAGPHTVNTDDQALSISNDTIYLADGGFVKLPSQTVDTQLDSVGISDLGFVAGPHTINTDNQSISGSVLNGTDLIIGIENGANDTINLSSLVTGLDTVYSSNDSLLLISNGFNDTTVVDLGGLADTDDQALSISNDTIFLVDGGFIKLPSTSASSDDQTLAFDTTTSILTIEDGNSVDISVQNNLTVNGGLSYGGATYIDTAFSYTLQDTDNLIVQRGSYAPGTQILILLPPNDVGRVITVCNASDLGGEVIQFRDTNNIPGILIGTTQATNGIQCIRLICIGEKWMVASGF